MAETIIVLGGRCAPAHMFVCGCCGTAQFVWDPHGIGYLKSEAEKRIREVGWSKTAKLGWICPGCKGAKR